MATPRLVQPSPKRLKRARSYDCFMNNELIPITPELNRLKEFLTALYGRPTLKELMKPTKRFLEMDARVRAENRLLWIHAVKGGPFPKIEV